jgi:hypothetical protein
VHADTQDGDFTNGHQETTFHFHTTWSPASSVNSVDSTTRQVIDTAAGAMNTAAQALGPEIQPLDTTVKQGAQFIEELKAQP